MTKKLIYSTSDNYGLIEVKENSTTRSLHFSKARQSAMFLNEHDKLAMRYINIMVKISKLFPSKTNLCLGLGGGSIPRYIIENDSEATVEVVELRKSVIDIAYDYFKLPVSKQLKTINMDAVDFMSIASRYFKETWDAIFIDLYDKKGVIKKIRERSFLEHIHNTLMNDGVAIFNVWKNPVNIFEMTLERTKMLFPYVHVIPLSSTSNQIIIASKTILPKLLYTSIK